LRGSSGSVFSPDWGRMETVFHNAKNTDEPLTTETWIADRDGFVIAFQSKTGSQLFKINGKNVYSNHSGLNVSSLMRTPLYPVRTGDVVEVQAIGVLIDGGFEYRNCLYFIPPVQTQEPSVNMGFSEDEIDTGRKWIDGKTIYRQVFSGNITDVIKSGVDSVIACGGYVVYNDVKYSVPGDGTVYVENGNVALNLGDQDGIDTYTIWLEFTKVSNNINQGNGS